MIEISIGLVALFVFLVVEEQKWLDVAAAVKPSIIAPLAWKSSREGNELFSLGLFLSMFGDLFLALPYSANFIRGTLFFTAAQCCYSLALLSRSEKIDIGSLTPYILVSLIVADLLKRSLKGQLRDVILIYIAISCLTGALSFNHALETGNYQPLCGSSLFIASDLLVVFDRFYFSFKYSSFWIMTSYFAAQALISS